MKTKDKQKALAFIAKYQLGGYSDDYQIQNPYQYDPNLQVAQQNQMLSPSTSTVQLNQLNSAKSQMGYQPKADLLDKAIPFISPAINLGIGVANIFSSIKEKSRQKAYERAFRKDLERRQTDQRFNDFYATPYSVSSGSTRSGAPGYQLGGQTNQPNQMELFLDYYNTQENNSDLLDQQFQKYYNDRNDQMEQSWKSKRQSGFSSLLKGAGDLLPLFQEGGNTNQVDTLKTKIKDIEMEKAKALVKMSGKDSTLFKDLQKTVRGANPEDLKTGFKSKRFGDRFREHQDGGEIDILNPVIDPTQDLYSPEYKVPTEIEDEISQVQIETSQEDAITQWLFEDVEEDPYKEEVTDQYLESFDEPIEVLGLRQLPIRYEGDISGLGKSIAVSHNNPGNIKIGKFAQRYGAVPGRQASDGGIFAKFPDVSTGLKAQRDLLQSSSYVNLSVAKAMEKWSNKGYGADLYPEIADKPMYLLTNNERIELQRRQILREDPSMYKLLYLK